VVFVVAKTVLKLNMKQNLSEIGFRLRALRKARLLTQESLAFRCQAKGCPVTRNIVARYELGMTVVPARFIPTLADILNANITDLLPPIARQPHPAPPLEPWQKPLKQKPAKAVNDTLIIRCTGATIKAQSCRTKDRQMISLSTTLQIPLKSLLAQWWKSL
jgi:transcriptional regulator with XRE-family HTH domain